jgi:hypothetical protein
MAPGDEKYVVFFAPEAGVVPHYIAHCVVAKTLEERGHRALIVRCLDVYPRCIVMEAETMPMQMTAEQRTDVCTMCRHYADRMTESYGLTVIDLPDLIDGEIRRKVEALTATLPEDLSTFEVEGVRLGKICGAEAAVTLKTTDFTGATPEVRPLLVQYLQGALLSYFVMQRLADTGKIARVVHFNEYAILIAAALAAAKRGIATTDMTMASRRGGDRRRFVFFSHPLAILSYRYRLKQWPHWRTLALPPDVVRDVTDDCLFRISGNSAMVYSPVRTGSTDEVFSQLSLSSGRRILVAFTSSLDEIAANSQYLSALGAEPFPERQPFRDQIEWLRALIERVEASADLQLIVRIHPREGANRRESIVSTHLAKLRATFDRPYKHVRFVWASDAISSYDLMELADVGLSAWSSTALEMARFGVPAVLAFDRHTPMPIGDVVRWTDTPDRYFQLLGEVLQAPPSLDLIRFAYRWTHLFILGCAFDVGDVVPDPACATLPPFKSPAVGASIEDVLVHGKAADEINRERLLAAQGPDADELEREALLAQLRRVIWFMCTGRDCSSDYRLCYRDKPARHLPPDCDVVLSRDRDYVELRTRDTTVRRRSRLVQRLGLLAAQRVEQRKPMEGVDLPA